MKNSKHTAISRIDAVIDRYALTPHMPRGRRESGTLETLPVRLGLPDSGSVAALLASGHLSPLGPVNSNDPDGAQRYASDHLNGIRREVFAALAGEVIDNYEGDNVEGLLAAISAALENYAQALPKDVRAVREFSAKAEREERPGLLRRAATGAAAAGAAYGGLSYLRGRKAGAAGLLSRVKTGHAANIADIRKAGERVRGLLRPRPRGVPGRLALPA